MKIMAVIAAKEKSKRLPSKNTKLLDGKPLIAYTIEYLKRQKGIDRIIVSTDSDKIAKIAIQYGAEVPFKRPLSLCLDNVPTFPVIKHAFEKIRKTGYKPDWVFWFCPTIPFRDEDLIRRATQIIDHCKTIISCYPIGIRNRVVIEKDDFIKPIGVGDMSYTKAFYITGHLLGYEAKSLISGKINNIYGYQALPLLISPSYIEIDTIKDFREAERYIFDMKFSCC